MRGNDMETETENKNNKWYIGMYTVLLGGFILYVVPLTRNQKPHNGSTAGTNVVQYVEADDDYETDYETDDDNDEIQKRPIGLKDIDLGVNKGPSNQELYDLIASNSVDEVEEFLNNVAFDEKWSEMTRALEVLESRPGWQSKTSSEIQMSYVSALKEFIPLSCAEFIPFLGSEREEVKEAVSEEIVDYIRDLEDEPFAASLIVKLSGVVKDSDFADGLVLKIESMEDEVAAIAMIGIMRNGTQAMKDSLKESMEFITDQPEMTEEAVMKWLVENKGDDVQ